MYVDSMIRVTTYPSNHRCRWFPANSVLFNAGQRISRVNSLAHGRFQINFSQVISKLNLVIDGWGISCEIVLRWMSMDLTDDKSALVHMMAWFRQATSHYLRQCWLRSVLPYDSLGHNELIKAAICRKWSIKSYLMYIYLDRLQLYIWMLSHNRLMTF